MAEWYYARNNQRLGPVSMEQLKQLAASGGLSPTDLVWKDGMANWAAASTIAGIFPAVAPAPAAPARPVAAAPAVAAVPAAVAPPPGVSPDDFAVAPAAPRGPAGPSIVDTAMLIATRAVSADLDTLKVSDAEKGDLSKAGVTGETAQRYLVWRRSMLWVALVPLAIGSVALAIDAMVNNFKPLSALGVMIEVFRILTLLALPAAAALGALFWSKPRTSLLMVTLGMLACFGFPLLMMIFPHGWLAEARDFGGGMSVQGAIPANLAFSVLVVVLSLPAGLVRGCLRVRSLLPESPSPAIALLGAAPVCALVFYGALVGGHSLLLNLFGLCLTLAPLTYLVGARTFLRPTTNPADRKGMMLWQWIAYFLCCGAALMAVFQLIYMLSKDEQFIVMKALYGPDTGGFYVIWTAFAFFLDFLGRSLFVSVFAAQFVLWLTQTAKTDPAAEKRLSELEPIVGKM